MKTEKVISATVAVVVAFSLILSAGIPLVVPAALPAALAGTSVVTGDITDWWTGDPINGSLVRVIDTATGVEVGNFTTGADGGYGIMVYFPAIGDTMEAKITASKDGFHTNYTITTLTGLFPPEIKTINLSLKEAIAPTVTVISPNGGENWTVGYSHEIRWTAVDNVGVTSIDIYYSTDGGATYPHIIAIGEVNDGAYTWTVPNTPSTASRVKVVAHDAAGNIGEDASDVDFTIYAYIVPGFDTGPGTYPSIAGTHTGTIELVHDLVVHRMYTYSSPGTGGHSKYVTFYHPDGTMIKEASWTGYRGNFNYIVFDEPFTLEAGVTYHFTIITGSYPQIIHNQSLTTIDGTITSTQFTDVNGKIHNNWIPAIRLE